VGFLAKLNRHDFATTEKLIPSAELLRQSIRAATKGYVVLADGLLAGTDEGAVLLSGGADTSQNEEDLFARYVPRGVELNNADPRVVPVVTVLTGRRKDKVT